MFRLALLLVFSFSTIAAAQRECAPGWSWSRRVVACVQTNCNSVQHAHYGYAGDCVCGSSGSIRENPNDPNIECSHPRDHATCPGCVYACVHRGQQCPGQAASTNQPSASRSCNYDQAIVELEQQANELNNTGQTLRRLSEADLPEFPELNYCVAASGNQISVQITDNRSVAQRIVNAVGAVESVGGLLGIVDDTPVPALSNLSVTVLQSVRGRIINARTTSDDNNAALNFMRDSQSMARGVNNVRERMICAVKRGVPLFYRRTLALLRRAEQMEREISGNSSCPRNLANLVRQKVRTLRRTYDWHAAGVIRPPGTSARSNYTLRRNWVDNRLDGRNRPAIFNEVRCR